MTSYTRYLPSVVWIFLFLVLFINLMLKRKFYRSSKECTYNFFSCTIYTARTYYITYFIVFIIRKCLVFLYVAILVMSSGTVLYSHCTRKINQSTIWKHANASDRFVLSFFFICLCLCITFVIVSCVSWPITVLIISHM